MFNAEEPIKFFDYVRGEWFRTEAIAEERLDEYIDIGGRRHEIEKINVTPENPYIHKYIGDVNLRSIRIKLLRFSDYLSFYKFLDKYPIHVPRFFDYLEIIDSKFRLLDEYSLYHKNRTKHSTMIMRSHPSLSILGGMAKKSVAVGRLYDLLLQKQIYYMTIQYIEELQEKFIFKSTNALWEGMDFNNISFLPKKFNRSKHFSEIKGILPAFYDEFTWDFWNLPSTYAQGSYFNESSTKFSKMFLKKFVSSYPFWIYREKFNSVYYVFYSNLMLLNFEILFWIHLILVMKF